MNSLAERQSWSLSARSSLPSTKAAQVCVLSAISATSMAAPTAPSISLTEASIHLSPSAPPSEPLATSR